MRPDFKKSGFSFCIAAGFLAVLLAGTGCNDAVWPDREPTSVNSIHVDSIKFLPSGTRYILIDSATPVLFEGYRRGYACSKVLKMDLELAGNDVPPIFKPVINIQLPAQPDCPVDSTERDSIVQHIFTGINSPIIVSNTESVITDSVHQVHGKMNVDSIVYSKADSLLNSHSKGRWTLLDSSSHDTRALSADTLFSCERLNQAELFHNGDTSKVRFTWVTLDSTDMDNPCGAASGVTYFPEITNRPGF